MLLATAIACNVSSNVSFLQKMRNYLRTYVAFVKFVLITIHV